MPITKSAKKALRVSNRRHTINLRVKRTYKDAVRDVRRPADKKPANAESAEKSTETLKKMLIRVYSELDKAAKKGVIHKNKAARLKSRLAKLILK